MSLLKKIAKEISPSLGGIDWVRLEGEFQMPREEIVYDISGNTGVGPGTAGIFRYVEYIREAAKRAQEALQNFQFSWSVQDNPATAEDELRQAMAAWDEVQYNTIEIGDRVLAALRANVETLGDNPLVVEKEQLRAVISSTYYTAVYGAVVHVNAFLQRSDVAPEDIVKNADDIVKTFNGLVRLAQMGVLNPYMNAPAAAPAEVVEEEVVVEGTGAIPVAVVVAVSVVLGVAIIAWCIVAVSQQQETNRAMKLMCEEAQRTGTEEDKQKCFELAKMNITATAGGPAAGLADAVKSVGEVLFMATLAYGAFMLLPPLVKAWKFRQTKAQDRHQYLSEAR